MVRPDNVKKGSLSGMRRKMANFVEQPWFTGSITALIIINAVTLGMETNIELREQYEMFFRWFDKGVLAVFTLEIVLKLFAYRLSFFRAGWNLFDFFIVAIALIPATGPLTILRALRIMRVLRLISIVPSMRRVINALFHAIPGMTSIMAILFIIFYVAAVLATKLFGHHPDAIIQDRFGDIGASMYSLFQIMTLEGWSEEIVRPVMNHYPMAWLFFIPFIILTSFAVLNLFIGIIVDTMHIAHEEGKENSIESVSKQVEDLQSDMDKLHKKLDKLKK